MAYLTKDELLTHLYLEVIDEISRDNDQLPEQAIAAAIAEVKSYLSAYDVVAIFGAEGNDRNPIILLYTKDIAVWHYIQLCNVATNIELRQLRYETATKWLDKVQRGHVAPDLPLPAPEGNSSQENFIKWGSNPKRNNHF